MTRDEVWLLMHELKRISDIVRLVDVAVTTQYSINEAHELAAEPYRCCVE